MPSGPILEPRDDLDGLLESVHPHRAPEHPLGQLRNLVEHRTARALADVLAELIEIVEVELRHHLDQPLASDVVAGRERVHVAFGLDGLARVCPHHRHQGLVEHPAVGELEHRDVDTFHVHVGGVGAEADAADVGEVRRAREQSHDPAAMEAGGREHEVVEVTGTHPGVVGDVDVALAHRLDGEVAYEVADRLGHGVDVARRSRDGLGEHSVPAGRTRRRRGRPPRARWARTRCAPAPAPALRRPLSGGST